MKIKNICLLASFFLLLAIIPDWNYNYYIFLRWGVSIVSLFVAWGFYKSKLDFWAIIFGIIAVIFNPIFPVYLKRDTWTLIDLITAILFILVSFSVKRKNE
jgi:hypothetical protein